MPAMRSLMVLIALRAIGVSANRRKLNGVGLGMTPARASVGAPGVKMVGSGTVLRADSPPAAITAGAVGVDCGVDCSLRNEGPATRRSAPRKASRMFIELSVKEKALRKERG